MGESEGLEPVGKLSFGYPYQCNKGIMNGSNALFTSGRNLYYHRNLLFSERFAQKIFSDTKCTSHEMISQMGRMIFMFGKT
jgi:hypothetical protein